MSKAGEKSPPSKEGGAPGRTQRSYIPLPPLDAAVESVPPFQNYFDDHIRELQSVQVVIQKKLSSAPALLDDQIREAEAWYGRMTSILAWADSYLDLAERKNLVPRHPDYTDVDREKHLAAAVSRERRFRDVVAGLVRSIETRVSLGQSLIKAYSGERRGP